MSSDVYIQGNIVDLSNYDVDVVGDPTYARSKLNEKYQDGIYLAIRLRQKGTPTIIKVFRYKEIDDLISDLIVMTKAKNVYDQTKIDRLKDELRKTKQGRANINP